MRYPWLGDIPLACYTCCVVIFLSAISSSLERTSTVFSKCSQIQFHFEKLKRGNSETSHQKTKRTTEGWDLIFRVDVCILLLGHICMLLSFHCYTNSFLHLVVFSTSEHDTVCSVLFFDYTCSQWYKHFTGLYLQVCKNRPTFKIIWVHKCCLIPHYYAFLLKNLIFKSKNIRQHIEFDNTWGYSWF